MTGGRLACVSVALFACGSSETSSSSAFKGDGGDDVSSASYEATPGPFDAGDATVDGSSVTVVDEDRPSPPCYPACQPKEFCAAGRYCVPPQPVYCLASNQAGISGCDYGAACALTDAGQITCVAVELASDPCNGGWCGSGCTCADASSRTCICGAP